VNLVQERDLVSGISIKVFAGRGTPAYCYSRPILYEYSPIQS
jgi:hypothetical protein